MSGTFLGYMTFRLTSRTQKTNSATTLSTNRFVFFFVTCARGFYVVRIITPHSGLSYKAARVFLPVIKIYCADDASTYMFPVTYSDSLPYIRENK